MEIVIEGEIRERAREGEKGGEIVIEGREVGRQCKRERARGREEHLQTLKSRD